MNPRVTRGSGFDEEVTVIVGVNSAANSQLAQVVHTFGALSLFFGPSQCRKNHGGEDCNNSNNNKELDQGKTALSGPNRKKNFHLRYVDEELRSSGYRKLT